METETKITIFDYSPALLSAIGDYAAYVKKCETKPLNWDYEEGASFTLTFKKGPEFDTVAFLAQVKAKGFFITHCEMSDATIETLNLDLFASAL